jgi:hypothetical protein
MSKKGEQDELQLLLRSRFPILVVETAEERRFLALIETVANLDDVGALHLERRAGPAPAAQERDRSPRPGAGRRACRRSASRRRTASTSSSTRRRGSTTREPCA